MGKQRLIVILLIISAVSVRAQSYTQTVRGQVIDVDSRSPVAGASIIVLDTDSFTGTTSDTEGKFRLLRVPVGRIRLKVSMIGYEEVMLSNIIVSTGKEVVLTVEMREKVYETGAVEIVYEKDKTKANNELVSNSARNFRSEETERYAGSRGDPSKMAANYAGVATGNDARNDIIVRGNSPMGVLWRLEGVDIPNPNHFSLQGATGGPVSILNNNLLGNSDFLTSAFPAGYGNKMGAVFDLNIRKGNNEKHEFTGQLGFNGLEAGAEGPLLKKNGGSYLVSYRYSTLEIFQLMGISFGVAALPKYQDMTFKIQLPTQNSGVFTLWGTGGLSTIELLDSKRNENEWNFTGNGEDLRFTSGMFAGGFSHLYFFNEKLSGKFNFSLSGSRYNMHIDTLSPRLEKFCVYKNKSLDKQAYLSYTLSNKFSSRHLLRGGASFQALMFDYNAYYYSRMYRQYLDDMKEKENSGIAQAYLHWQYRISDRLVLNNGFHAQYFVLNGSHSSEPRSGIVWQFRKNHNLSLAGGMHSQMLPILYYFNKTYDESTGNYVTSNRELDFMRSIHAVAGYDYNFAADFRLKLEAYNQWLYNIPVESNYRSSFSMINLGLDLEGMPYVDSLTNTGTGRNYGIELTIEKFFSKHYYFLSTLSLYESLYKGSDGIERHSKFSNGYVYNLLGGIELVMGKNKNKILSFDAKLTFAGGNLATPVNVDASLQKKQAVEIDSLAYSYRLKDYSRIDLKATFRINSKKVAQLWFINVENILNTKNVFREYFDPDRGEYIREYQLGLFPYAGYRIEF